MLDKIKSIFGMNKSDNVCGSKKVESSSDNKKSEKMVNDYLIIGASAAGINAVKTLRELDPDSNITVISKDEKIYSRCMLHHIISEHRSVKSINFVDDNFMEQNNINWIKGATVASLDTDNKKVIYNIDGDTKEITYSKLLISSGAKAFIPPIKNIKEGKNIYPLRDLEDSVSIRDIAKKSKKVAIIGGGLVGIDALSGLMELDNLEEISLILSDNRILDKQLDNYAASVYQEKFKEKGVKIYPSCNVKEVLLDENNQVSGVNIGNGKVVECELLIVSTGVRANIEFLNDSNIEIDKGIKVNNKCETNIQDVYAAGDVIGTGIWPLATKQAIVAASNMVGIEKTLDDYFQFKNTMNFMGIPTVSLGITTPPDDSYLVMTQIDGDNYKKAVIKDDVLTGYVVQGDISYVGPFTKLVKDQIKVDNLEKRIFEMGYSDFFSIKENGEFEWTV